MAFAVVLCNARRAKVAPKRHPSSSDRVMSGQVLRFLTAAVQIPGTSLDLCALQVYLAYMEIYGETTLIRSL